MDTIDRVDDMVRKNIMKYTEQKNQQLYQQQLQQYQKQRKRDALKSYAQIIKEGNRKAVQKMKQKTKATKKNKNKTTNQQPNIEITEDNGQNKKNKLNQNEIKRIQSAIQTRAQRILQQKHLQKLDKQLAQQKKKTKLYQLNQRCRKIAKSSVKIPVTISVMPQQRRKILQQFQKKAMEEVQQLDDVINNILTKKPDQNNKIYQNQKEFKSKSIPKLKQNWKLPNTNQQIKTVKNQINFESSHTLNSQFDPFQHPLFTKSTQELLSLDYIPL